MGEGKTKSLAGKHGKFSWEIISKLEKHISKNVYQDPSTLQIERATTSDCTSYADLDNLISW
jgi:hypothetical protein